MQTISATENGFHASASCLSSPAFGLFRLPVLDINIINASHKIAKTQLSLATEDEKTQASQIIMQSHKLKLIDDKTISREFDHHRKGDISERGMLINLHEQCDKSLTPLLPHDYMVDINIEGNECVLTGYDIHEINIDTSELALEERWTIYSVLELVSRFQLPLMTPEWYVKDTYSIFSEIDDSDEFNELVSQSMKIESLDELRNTIESSYEYMDSLVNMMGDDISIAITAIMDYDKAIREFELFNKYQKKNKLGIPSSQKNYSAIIDHHINALSKYSSSISQGLINVLNLLKASDLYVTFERLENDDAQSLDYATTVMDIAYAPILAFMQEAKLDELNQVGEPLKESIPFNDRVIERLDLLTKTYKEFTRLSDEGNVK